MECHQKGSQTKAVVWTTSDEAQRALRVAARLHLLNTAHRQWHDVEGIDEVDMVASSGGAWKLWLESLSNVENSF